MRRRPLSTPAKLNVAAMIVAAGGILLQIASGSEAYPAVPPGPIILLGGAGVVALGPWRWSAIVGAAVPLFLTVGALISAAADGAGVQQLTDPAEVGIFAGTVIQMLTVITALVAGIVAARQTYRDYSFLEQSRFGDLRVEPRSHASRMASTIQGWFGRSWSRSGRW